MLFSQLQHANMQFLKKRICHRRVFYYISENWEAVLMLLFQHRQLAPDRVEICIVLCDYAFSFMLLKFVVLFILEWVESEHIIFPKNHWLAKPLTLVGHSEALVGHMLEEALVAAMSSG